MVRRKSIGRAIAVLALGGVLALSFAISPSFSASFATKSSVKKKFVRANSGSAVRNTTETDLGPSYSTLMSAPVKITTNSGTILAAANVNLRDTTDGVNQVECRLIIGTFPTGNVIDQWVANVEQAGGGSGAGNGSRRVTYPLNGGAKVAKGTYTVTVHCGEAAAQTGVKADGGSLTTWVG